MIDYFKKFFSKEETEDTITSEHIFGKKTKHKLKPDCEDCVFKLHCNDVTNISIECDYVIDLEDFDGSKDTILLVDDHEGLISFLKDDFQFILSELEIDDLNILTISGKDAAFNFEAIQKKHKDLRIKYAVLDITLGGTRMTDNGIQKYTGVDIFEMIYKLNPNLSYLFYTGNNLNTYIKSNKRIVDQFKSITNRRLKDFVLFKTSLDIDGRRKKLTEKLFKV